MKIYLCTTVTSKNYKSWSNIPYLLHKNLEKKGYVVKNHVIFEIEPIKTIFNLPIRVINKICKTGITYFYVRTPLHFLFTYLYSHYIRLISDKKDVMLVQGFSYPLNNGKNQQIILGDWPSEYLYEKLLQRKPNRLERKSIDRENNVIEAADAVITLFPNVQTYMLEKYKNKNIYYLGNFVNVDEDIVVPDNIMERKLLSNRFVFIGQPFYLQGALELIAATRSLRERGFNCEVDIIGIERNLIGEKENWLNIHGYLDKENAEDKKKYYSILSNARMFVNTTKGWSGFQALLEAMYFYTPIVVRTNDSLKSYFNNLTEIAYIIEDEGLPLDTILEDSISNKKLYMQMSVASRNAVESSTWANFTNKLVDLFK